MTTQTPEFQAILVRLEKLENQSRFMKRAFLVLLLLVGASLIMGEARRGQPIQGEEFLLKDLAGNVRAKLEVRGEERHLTLLDPHRDMGAMPNDGRLLLSPFRSSPGSETKPLIKPAALTSIGPATPVLQMSSLTGFGKTLRNLVSPSPFALPLRAVLSAAKELRVNLARNLALQTRTLRDSSLPSSGPPAAPRNDRLDGFFRSLLGARSMISRSRGPAGSETVLKDGTASSPPSLALATQPSNSTPNIGLNEAGRPGWAVRAASEPGNMSANTWFAAQKFAASMRFLAELVGSPRLDVFRRSILGHVESKVVSSAAPLPSSIGKADPPRAGRAAAVPDDRGPGISLKTPVPTLHKLEKPENREIAQLTRNPFEFATARPVKQRTPGTPEPSLPAAPAAPAAPAITQAAPPVTLKALGYAEKAPGSPPEAIVSDEINIYVVHEGDTFGDRFSVSKIEPTFVEVHDASTNQTVRLTFSP